jgi:hypothetical protein
MTAPRKGWPITEDETRVLDVCTTATRSRWRQMGYTILPICRVETKDRTQKWASERFNIVELALNRTAQRCAQPVQQAVHRQFRGTCHKDTRHPITASSGGVEGPAWNPSSFHPLPPRIFALSLLSRQPLCPCTASPEQLFTDPFIPFPFNLNLSPPPPESWNSFIRTSVFYLISTAVSTSAPPVSFLTISISLLITRLSTHLTFDRLARISLPRRRIAALIITHRTRQCQNWISIPRTTASAFLIVTLSPSHPEKTTILPNTTRPHLPVS